MPKLCSGTRHLSAAISSRSTAACACVRPAPPYSRGHCGTVQPRSAMRCIHWRCASLWNLKRLPPQQTSASVFAGWRISSGQFASSQARVVATESVERARVCAGHVGAHSCLLDDAGWVLSLSRARFPIRPDTCSVFLAYNSLRNHTANSKAPQGDERDGPVVVAARDRAPLMGAYLARRLLALIPTLLLASVIVFVTIRLIPAT
jgi:hypothetical protein